MQEDNITTIISSNEKKVVYESSKEKEQSPEVFISEDNIVNTQESMEVDDNLQLTKDTVLDKDVTEASDPVVVPGKDIHQI